LRFAILELAMITIREILVPTDFSEPARAALDYAKELATLFGSRLHIMHVVATPQAGWAADSASFAWPTLLADLEADSRERLKELVPPGDPLAERTALVTQVGVPVADILEYAKARDIDLIVMGTHGRGFMGHVLLGSVAERVVRLAAVPVVTVHGAPHPAATAAMRSSQADARPHEVVPS
jgi:nucleotide-binding universal stress UspA family protein